ncbi:hypothetical protein BGX26_000036 [Mortierella sp. AD094]|nr:hypothetical protein BGX26_000036 [Mortierella sp. AD094]
MSLQLNFNTHADNLKSAYESVLKPVDPKNSTNWAMFGYDKGTNDLKVLGQGSGGLEELEEEFMDGKIQYAFVRTTHPKSQINKFILIAWCGDGVPESKKGLFNSHFADVSQFIKGYHIQISARCEADVAPAQIMKKINDLSGSTYSAHMESYKPETILPRQSAYKKTEISDITAMRRNPTMPESAPKRSLKTTTEPSSHSSSIESTPSNKIELPSSFSNFSSSTETKSSDPEVNKAHQGEKEIEPGLQEEHERQDHAAEESAESDNTAEEYEQQLQQREREEREATERQLAQQREEEEARQRREQEVLEEERRLQEEVKKSSLQDQAAAETLDEHSSITRGDSAIVLFSFESCTEDEMPLLEGEIIHNVKDLGGGWWRGESADGIRSGLFPGNHIETIHNPEEYDLTVPFQPYGVMYAEATHDIHEPMSANGHPTVDEVLSALPTALALYDFNAGDSNEISFSEGDILKDIDQCTKDWWSGQAQNGIIGLFPSNYVELHQ